jgi:hypothetical protein
MLCAWRDERLPAVADRGGWYTIRFAPSSLTVTTSGPVLPVL